MNKFVRKTRTIVAAFAATLLMAAGLLAVPTGAQASVGELQLLHTGTFHVAETINSGLGMVGDNVGQATCDPESNFVEPNEVQWQVWINVTTRVLYYKWIGQPFGFVNPCAESITIVSTVIDQQLLGTDPVPTYSGATTKWAPGHEGRAAVLDYNDVTEVPYYAVDNIAMRSQGLGSVTVQGATTYGNTASGPQPGSCAQTTWYFTPTPNGPVMMSSLLRPRTVSC